ncbi:hypothetical protein G9464_18925 [Halostella sp. JP-L12]|uniref:hypothetical protein n=1 Tax=Halostella TaxID=1843185 RepID=UPI000EF788E1|nr:MULTISPECIES: hypothetical protein [Halostella]NHN49646.1 hypothetical protein [Halostella sp. JP-L12]
MTDRSDAKFDPTHVLLATEPADGTAAAEVRRTNAALWPVLDRGDRVDLWLAARQLGDDHPDVRDEIAASFRRLDEGRFRGRLPACRDATESLLSLTSFHRFVSLERLEVRTPDGLLLRHVPDHGTFDLDETAAAGVARAIEADLDDVHAALWPARTLAEWWSDGRRYAVRPPQFCVEREDGKVGFCTDLSGIWGIAVDRDRRRIDLRWGESSDGLLGRIGDAIRPTPPSTFRFDDEGRFESAAAAFELVGEKLDAPVRTSGPR